MCVEILYRTNRRTLCTLTHRSPTQNSLWFSPRFGIFWVNLSCKMSPERSKVNITDSLWSHLKVKIRGGRPTRNLNKDFHQFPQLSVCGLTQMRSNPSRRHKDAETEYHFGVYDQTFVSHRAFKAMNAKTSQLSTVILTYVCFHCVGLCV